MVQRVTIKAQQCQGKFINLEKDQIHYLTRVLRLGAGDRFIAQDGLGHQWVAVLTKQPNQADIIEAVHAPDTQRVAPLRLIAALPKGNSFDQVVRQTTELGVTHLYPVLSDRTLLRPSDRKLARWQRIAQEASEQSERITVPEVFPPIAFQQCLKQIAREGGQSTAQTDPPNSNELRYICVARRDKQTPHLLAQLIAQKTKHLAPADSPGVTLAVGPEGGWTSQEITDAITESYETVSLGSVILRSVTAPITALSLVIATREALI